MEVKIGDNMEELSLDMILSPDEISDILNGESTPEVQEPVQEETQTTPETTEINVLDELDLSESVGSAEDNTGKGDTESSKGNSSPNFYSSIANALVEDGIFQTPENYNLADVKTAEDFAELIDKQIQAKFDERQKRIDHALGIGIEPSEIQKYEGYMNTLSNITEEALSEENEKGENLRKNLIYQDCINRGFSKERAIKYIEKSFKNGDDIEDAKEALQSNKEYFQDKYNTLLKEAEEEKKKEEQRVKEEADKLRTSILDNDKAFGGISLDKKTRQKVYDTICKPVFTDPNTGERLTEIQKYELQNRTEFLKNIGLIYTLTDGFKNLDRLTSSKVNQEVKKGIKHLENTINSTQRNTDGSLRYTSGVGDPESKISNWKPSF